MKIFLEAGPGGHLVEMSRIWPALCNHELLLITNSVAQVTTDALHERFPWRVCLIPHRFVAFRGNKFADYAMSFVVDLVGNLPFYVRLFRRERPGLLISTGAATTIIASFMARVSGAKAIFIESSARVSSLSFNGRIVYWFASVFLVQWESLLTKCGRKAQYWGNVL